MRSNLNPSIYGVGIRDTDHPTSVNGVRCPVYRRWTDILGRCYSPAKQSVRPLYIGCTVEPDWLLFSNFKRWMESQDWQGKQIDKDLLVPGNKHYGPDTCVFIDQLVNTFIVEAIVNKGNWPTGVNFNESRNKFRAQCSNPLTKKIEHLGFFTDPHEAHLAWRKRKHELACILAEQQSDPRVADALRTRYSHNN